ncbi:choline transporter [Polychaeton citri CBS 116435]|uniref:Choline transporter n=1 Tax=Polychaeton citri CBS 116435 TaxID=1314669 RepID=A0A9P4Q5Q6_9PEZI|nr:choline transporter [Polychaeton citri CBS 116435]
MGDMSKNLEPTTTEIEKDNGQIVPGSSKDVINTSGHRQELERNFGLWSICATGVVTGNTWTALGGTIVVAFYNGGPPGVIYELIAVSVCYWFVAASIAELASSIPASGGVYHWATATAGTRAGRVCGWFAGWWNFLAWISGVSAGSAIVGNAILFCYTLYYPELEVKRWHIFIVYQIITWACCSTVLFCNRALPRISSIGSFFMIGGVFVTILVCAIMPSQTGKGYASNSFVWKDWQNGTGYQSNGLVFVTGMLNGAFAVGTPDCLSHLAEEIPRPSANIPKAIFAQVAVGFITAIVFLISIFYSINDLPAIFAAESVFPLGNIYYQATGSRGGAVGLVIVILVPITIATVGCYTTVGRILWTLARDKATPYDSIIGRVSPRWHNPFAATFVCGCISCLMGAIYVGSSTAFNAFVGAFVVLSTASYLAAIIPHLLTRRRNVPRGVFWMGGSIGFIVNTIACLYMMAFMVVYCFPYSTPTTAAGMNYASLVTGGLTIFVAIGWFFARKSYVGPQIVAYAATA